MVVVLHRQWCACGVGHITRMGSLGWMGKVIAAYGGNLRNLWGSLSVVVGANWRTRQGFGGVEFVMVVGWSLVSRFRHNHGKSSRQRQLPFRLVLRTELPHDTQSIRADKNRYRQRCHGDDKEGQQVQHGNV